MIRVFFAVLAVLCVVGSVTAFRLSLSSAYNHQAMRYELFWQKQGAPRDEAQWQRALDWSARALALDESNPAMHLRRSRLLSWYGSLSELDGNRYVENLDKAATHVERAVVLHPYSAEGYSSRAALTAQRGLVNEQLNSDIVRSLAMGPWERDVYLRVLNAGLFNWPRLEDSTRAALRQYFDLAVKEKPGVAREMFAIAARYNRLSLLCSRLAYLQGDGITDFTAQQCKST
ncbi:MAG: hypothetical protein AAGI24_10950 [Pseudomonadota bacterium]